METPKYFQYLLSFPCLLNNLFSFFSALIYSFIHHTFSDSLVYSRHWEELSRLTDISSAHLPFSVISRLSTLESHLDCNSYWQLVCLPAFQCTLHCHTRVIFLIHRCPSWQQLLTKAFSNHLFSSTCLSFSNHSQKSLCPLRLLRLYILPHFCFPSPSYPPFKVVFIFQS